MTNEQPGRKQPQHKRPLRHRLDSTFRETKIPLRRNEYISSRINIKTLQI